MVNIVVDTVDVNHYITANVFNNYRARGRKMTDHLPTSVRHSRRISAIETATYCYKGAKSYDDSARRVLNKMVERAEHDERGYGREFTAWIVKGGTVRLRDLCAPFGDYWGSIDFANVVDILDSSHGS